MITSQTPVHRTANHGCDIDSCQVFRYDGSGPVVKREVDVLWDAVWQPAAQGVYPDRPASPGRKGPTAADAAAGKLARHPAPKVSTTMNLALLRTIRLSAWMQGERLDVP